MTLRKIDTSRLYLPERHFLLEPTASNVPESIALLNDGTGFGHYDGEYLSVLGMVTDALKQLFRSSHPTAFPVPGSAMSALEVILTNACEPGEKVLVVDTGGDAAVILETVRDSGLAAAAVGGEGVGAPVPREAIVEALLRERPKVLVLVHGDVETGIRQDLAGLREAADEAGSLLVADVSSTLGGQEVLVDEWGLDGAYACVERCLNCPPGLAVLTLSDRLLGSCHDRSSPVGSLQPRLDDLMQQVGAQGQGMSFNPTVPIGLVFCLQGALGLCLAEGLENRWRRHADAGSTMLQGLEELGFTALTAPLGRLDTVVAVRPPAEVEPADLRLELSRRYRIDVGAVEEPFVGGEDDGTRWLIGLMGVNATRPVVQHVIRALRELLGEG